jgi:hypothetical protein
MPVESPCPGSTSSQPLSVEVCSLWHQIAELYRSACMILALKLLDVSVSPSDSFVTRHVQAGVYLVQKLQQNGLEQGMMVI